MAYEEYLGSVQIPLEDASDAITRLVTRFARSGDERRVDEFLLVETRRGRAYHLHGEFPGLVLGLVEPSGRCWMCGPAEWGELKPEVRHDR